MEEDKSERKDAVVAELERIIAEQKRCVDGTYEIERYPALDHAFHHAIIECFGNELFNEAFSKYSTSLLNMTKYTTPVAIFLLVSGILNILDTEHIINANLVLAFSLTSIIYCLINYLKKDDNIYKLSLMISVTLTLLSTSTNTNILVSIISSVR